VRRIEGILLHPERDSCGVHHFCADEVEQLAADIRRGHVKLAHQLRATSEAFLFKRRPGACSRCMTLEQDVAALRQELGTLSAKVQRAPEVCDLTAQIETLLVELER
jgi:hypothetical protein